MSQRHRDHKETDIPCNCPWYECSAHEGGLCPNNAIAAKCPSPDCEGDHFIGDKALGEGIHLCTACGHATRILLVDNLCDLMTELSEYTPPSLKFMEKIVRDHYIEAKNSIIGWQQPFNDVRAVLGLSLSICSVSGLKANDISPRVTPELIQKVIDFTDKFNRMVDAYDFTKDPVTT